MNKIVIGILLATTMLLAGCTEGMAGFDASINVTSTSSVDDGDGLCGYGDDEECHSVTVELTNNGEDSVSTNMYYWEAQASSGGVFTAPMVDGPDACASGSTCTLTLNFDVTNGDKLTKLTWDDVFNNMETSIPSY
jgi:hypothetical protein